MLAIVSLQIPESPEDRYEDFAEEMIAFGWTRHPLMRDTFFAEFPDTSVHADVLSTIHTDIGMCLGAAEADHCTGAIGIARRDPMARELLWED